LRRYNLKRGDKVENSNQKITNPSVLKRILQMPVAGLKYGMRVIMPAEEPLTTKEKDAPETVHAHWGTYSLHEPTPNANHFIQHRSQKKHRILARRENKE